jgi:hypothetical protein
VVLADSGTNPVGEGWPRARFGVQSYIFARACAGDRHGYRHAATGWPHSDSPREEAQSQRSHHRHLGTGPYGSGAHEPVRCRRELHSPEAVSWRRSPLDRSPRASSSRMSIVSASTCDARYFSHRRIRHSRSCCGLAHLARLVCAAECVGVTECVVSRAQREVASAMTRPLRPPRRALQRLSWLPRAGLRVRKGRSSFHFLSGPSRCDTNRNSLSLG